MGERFFRPLLYGTLPLLIWAFHFFAVYALAAAQCSAAATLPAPRGALPAMLATLSVLALGACALLLWRARGTLRGAERAPGLLDWAHAGSAVLALLGVIWTCVPMLMIGSCG